MRTLVAVVVVASAAGCSVDVGAGQIAPVEFDEPIDADGESPPMFVPVEVEFLSADQSGAIADQFGSKLGAVTAIDVSVQALDIVDVDGAPVTGGVLIVVLDGVTIDKVGQRVRLPDDLKRQVLDAIGKRAALDVTVQCTIGWTVPAPPGMAAHAIVQPIAVVDALKAL
jgi:hypothetical protein